MATFNETFTAANNATLTGDLTWSEYVGTAWETSTNRAQHLNTSGRAVAVASSATMASDDYRVTATVPVALALGSSTSVEVGVCARQPDLTTQTYYNVALRLDATSTTLVLRKTVAGTDTTLVAAVTVTPSYPCTIAIEVQGNNQRAYLNDVLQSSATDTELPTGRRFAIRSFRQINSGTATLDSLTAADLAVGGTFYGSQALTGELNRLANGGTYPARDTYLSAQGAANKWAATSGFSLLAALNIKAGNSVAAGTWRDLNGVCNQLAGTSGFEATAALQQRAS